MALLRYGIDSFLDLPDAVADALEPCGAPKGAPLADPAGALRAALAEPLEYPSLAMCTTPGDRVAIALGAELPHAAELTATVVETLLGSGIAPDGITILRSGRDAAAGAGDPCCRIAPAVAERIRVLTHDPTSRRDLAYLAASEGGEPILLNRMLTDADVVLPIGCMRPTSATGYYGIHTALYPEFSDQKTQARFRKYDGLAGNGRHNGHHRELRHEVNHVAWLLGVAFAVQVVPGSGETVLHIVAGESEAVREHGRELYRDAWISPVARRADLVVAAIEGGGPQQTWENLGRVLESAGRLVEDDGAIAVCCDLAQRPGPATQRLLGAPSREAALRHIRHDNLADSLTAVQLAKALDSHRVYLLSRLDPGMVEELEMIPVDEPADISRLAQRSRSCLVVANALRAMVRVEGE